MECEKCQDVGFIDLDRAGLVTRFCDCEIGKAILAKKRAIYSIPEEVADGNNGTESEKPSTIEEQPEEEDVLKIWIDETGEACGALEPQEGGIVNDPKLGIVDRTESDNRDIGSGDPSQSEKPQKRKAPKKARKRAK